MRSYRHLHFFLFLLTGSVFYGQTFQKTYGAGTNLQGTSVQQTNDKGFIICGNITIDSANADLCLVKTNLSGDTLWRKTYGGPGGEHEGMVRQTTDGGYVILGTTYSSGAGQGDILMIKTDSTGDTLWTRTFGGTGDEIGQSIFQTHEGGYIIGGHTDSFGARGEFYLIRTYYWGDTVWTRTFGGAQHDHGFSVLQAADGNFLLAGHSVSFSTNGGFYVVKASQLGDTIWSRGYGGRSDSYCYSIAETHDGGYILAGTTTAFGAGGIDAMVVKININGDTLWSRTYGTAGDEYFNCVKALPGSGYILTGSTSRGIDSSNVYVVKIDENGDTLWTRTFGGSKDDEGTFVDVCADSGYVVSGNTRSTSSGRSEIYLLRMDSMGNAGCTWLHTNTLVSKPDSVMYGVATTKGIYAAAVGTAPFTAGHLTLNETDGCAVFGIPVVSPPEFLVRIYPNPTSDILEIRSEVVLGVLRIYDNMGHICHEEKNHMKEARVKLEQFAPGLYVVEVAGRYFRVVKE